jgi:hypothetical protein
MNGNPPNLTVIPGGGAAKLPPKLGTEVESPPPPPGDLSPRELEIWNYICAQLRNAGIEHTTFGLAGIVVCKLYADWLSATERLEQLVADEGTYMTKTPNGYEQPHQAYYVARDLRKELLAYLPECCLTIPSFANVRSKLGGSGQLDLPFSSLVAHASADRKSYSTR